MRDMELVIIAHTTTTLFLDSNRCLVASRCTRHRDLAACHPGARIIFNQLRAALSASRATALTNPVNMR